MLRPMRLRPMRLPRRKTKEIMNKKPSRPVQILLYSALALGLVFVLRLAFGGLTGTGERVREKWSASGRVTLADRLNMADADRRASGQSAPGQQVSGQPAAFENDKTGAMNTEFMRRAIDLAAQNIREGGGPFAAVIVKDGRIVAECGNSVTRSLDPTAHAEVNAIREACRRLQTFELRGCEIYSSCEPCPMCMAAIYWARLDVLYFAATRYDAAQAGFDDDFLYRELPLEYRKRSLPCFNVMAEEGKLPFVDWAQYDEKIPY